jgi:hypothetical protein
MAKLVASIFNEYLSVLFEDFSSKNVNSKLFTGKIHIQNVNVRKDLLKEILDPVFPNIEIVQALCDSVSVHIPTLHLKSQPVEVKISALHIILREPVEFTAVSTNLLSKFDKNGGGKSKEPGQAPAAVSWNAGLAIAFGATVQIDLIDIRLEPLVGADGLRPPMLRLELMNLKIYSTDDKWRKVPLNKSWELSRSNNDAVQVFKVVSIDSISASFESEQHSYAILTLPLLLRLHLSLSRNGMVPRSIFVEVVVNTCSIKLGCDEMRHLFIFLLSLERCLQRSNKAEVNRESNDVILSRGRAHSAAEAISDITGRFAKADITEELARELSSGGGAEEDSSIFVGVDGGEEVHSSGKAVPTFKLRFSANEIRLDLLLGGGDIYVLKVSDCGVGNQLLVCVDIGPVDGSNDALLLSSAESVVVGTNVHATIPPIIMERLSSSSNNVTVLTILSDSFSMCFLHPRPPPPQKGFSIRWDLAQIFIHIPLDDCARLYGMIMSDDVLSWISRDPGIFSRLALSGSPPPYDPYDIRACEFEAHMSLKILDVAVPLTASDLWCEGVVKNEHDLQLALRVRIDDIRLTSDSSTSEKPQLQQSEFTSVERINFGRNDRNGRAAHLTIQTAAVKVCLCSTSIDRFIMDSQDVASTASKMPSDAALFVQLPSLTISLQFPLAPIPSNIQEQALFHIQSLTKLVQIKKGFAQTGHIKNRMYILKSHSNCFPASVLIDWMNENGHVASRADAILIGRQFLIHQFIRCVGGSPGDFCDDDSLYRFFSDETGDFKDRHMWLRILAAQEQKILQAEDGLLDRLNRDFSVHQDIPRGSNPLALRIECPAKALIVLDCLNLLHAAKVFIPLLELFSLHAGLAHISMLGLIDMSNRRCMFTHPNFSTCLIAPTHLAIDLLVEAIDVRVVMKSSSDTTLSAANTGESNHVDISIGCTRIIGDAPPDLMMLKMRRLWEDSNGVQPQPIPQLNLKISMDSFGVFVSIPQVASCPLPVIYQPEVEGCQQIVLDISMSVDGALPNIDMCSFLEGVPKINQRLGNCPKNDGPIVGSQKPNVVLVVATVKGLCACFSVDVIKQMLQGVVATVSSLDSTCLLKFADVFGCLSSSGSVLLSNDYLTSARMCLLNLTSMEHDSVFANDVSINMLQIWQRELKFYDEEQTRSVNDHLSRALWCFGIDFHGSSFNAEFRASQLSPNYIIVKVDSVAARAAFIQQLRSKLDPLPDLFMLALSAPSIESLMRRIIQNFAVLGAQFYASLGICTVSCAVIGQEAPTPSFRLSKISFEASAFLKSLCIGSAVSQNMFWEDLVGRVDFNGKDSDGSLNFVVSSTFVQEIFHAFNAAAMSAADIRSLFELKFPSAFLSLLASTFAHRSILKHSSSGTDSASNGSNILSPTDQHKFSSQNVGATIYPPLSVSSRSLLAVRKLDSSLGILHRVAEFSLGRSVAPFLASNASSRVPLPKPLPSWATGVTVKSSDKLTTGFPWSHSFSETSFIEGFVRFCRCEKEAVKKGPSFFFNSSSRVNWLTKWAVVRSNGSLLLFDDSNASSPPSVRVDITFAQYNLVSSDSSKIPSLWPQSPSGDCIFIRPPVGADLLITIADESSTGFPIAKLFEAFHECALAVRVQKTLKDEAAASLARVLAFRDAQEVGCSLPSDALSSSSIPVQDAIPVLVDAITYARDQAISSHVDLSSARAELEITKRALASSAQDVQTLRMLLQQREEELVASKHALKDAVLLKQNALSDASKARASIQQVSLPSRISSAVRPSLALPLHVGPLGKVSADSPSDDESIPIASSSRIISSADLLAVRPMQSDDENVITSFYHKHYLRVFRLERYECMLCLFALPNAGPGHSSQGCIQQAARNHLNQSATINALKYLV